ncbi:MAG: hypothetical protein K6E29_02720 [Cyanobacteria bacterium RUI128]|nr:hypothetical protein [Cyanobacteria bacterium RUI128]
MAMRVCAIACIVVLTAVPFSLAGENEVNSDIEEYLNKSHLLYHLSEVRQENSISVVVNGKTYYFMPISHEQQILMTLVNSTSYSVVKTTADNALYMLKTEDGPEFYTYEFADSNVTENTIPVQNTENTTQIVNNSTRTVRKRMYLGSPAPGVPYADLNEAVSSTDSNKTYTLGDDEEVTSDLDTMNGTTLTVEGNSYSINGNTKGGISVLGNSKILTIQNVGSTTGTIAGGNFTVVDSVNGFGSSTANGGVINNAYGTINITNSVFSGNTANNGGIVYSQNTGANVNISNSTFYNNTASNAGGVARIINGSLNATGNNLFYKNSAKMGGAIYNQANATIFGNFVENNATNNKGGAIHNAGSATVGGLFKGNFVYKISAQGGAIYNTGTLDILENTTFQDNYVRGSNGYGGAIYNSSSGTVNIASGTEFSNNLSWNSNGGAIYNEGIVSINAYTSNVTFSGNTASGVANDIHNISTLNLQAKEDKSITFAGTITDATTPTGTTTIGGTYTDAGGEHSYSGTVDFNNTITQNTINVNSGTAKFSNTVTTTNFNLNGGTALLNGVSLNNAGTVTVADGAAISTQNNSISATNLGNIILNGVMNLALDANLSGAGSIDTFSATNVSGTGSININNIKILADSTSALPIELGTFDDNLKGYVTLSATNVLGVAAGKSYAVSYDNITGSLKFNYGDLYNAVKDTSAERTYTMETDENVSQDLGAMGGANAKLTVNGGNYAVNGNSHEGITVSTGQTLEINNIGSVDADGNIQKSWNTVSSENGGVVYNAGTLNITDSVFSNNTASEKGGAVYNTGTTNIIADTANVKFSGNTANGVANDIHNVNALNLQAKEGKSITFAGTITDATTPTGTTTIGGTGYTGTVNFNGAVTQNTVNVNNGTAKFSNTITTTNFNLNGGTTLLNGVSLNNAGTVTAADGATLSTQNGTTSATNLGNLVLNGVLALAMDADLSGTGSADTFSATSVSGTGSININNIKILADSTSALPITIGTFDDNLKSYVTLTSTKVDGVAAGKSYAVSYDNTNGNLKFNYGNLYTAVKDTSSERTYTMGADEDVAQDLGSMNGTTLTINGNNHSVNGTNFNGITVGTNQELSVNNVGSVTGSLATDDLTVVDSWNGAYGYYSNTASVILNSGGTVNISDSVFYNNSRRPNGGALVNNSNMNISGDTYFISNKSTDYSGGAIFNDTNGTLTIKNGADVLFYDNTSPKGNAGAIYNQGTFTVEEGASVEFNSNTSRNGGSAIYQTGENAVVNLNGTSTSKIIFNNNSVNTIVGNGGAIASVNAKELNINYADFISNKANVGSSGTGSSAGAIYADNVNKVSIENSTFTGNQTYKNGGAVALNDVAAATIKKSTFTNNTTQASGSGGALYVSGNTNLTLEDTNFTNNTAGGLGNGGAIYNTATTTIIANTDNVTFSDNTAGGGVNDIHNIATLNLQAKEGKSITFDGTLTDASTPTGTTTIGGTYTDAEGEHSYSGTVNFNNTVTQNTINIISGTMNSTATISANTLNNNATGTISSTADITAGGGTNNGSISTSASFNNTGNLTNNSSITATTGFNNSGNIVNDGNENSKITTNSFINNGTVSTSTSGIESPNNLQNEGTITYTSGSVTTNDITGSSAGNVILATGNDLTLDNVVSGNQLTLQSSTIIPTENTDIFQASQFNINGGGMSVLNNEITDTNLGNVVMNNNTNLALDFNLSEMKSDTFTTSSLTTNGNQFNVNNIKISGHTLKDHFSFDLGQTTNLGVGNVTSDDITLPTIMTPVRKIKGHLKNGTLSYAPAGNDWKDFNSAVLAAPVAAQIGGYLTQLNTYDEAFQNRDMKLLMTKKEREVYKFANKYANMKGGLVYTHSYPVEQEPAMWYRGYATFERVNLNRGPKVSNILYGAFGGGESKMYDIGHGFHVQYSGYLGYTGSHQAFIRNDIYQNGGTLGATAMLYKGGFFTGITANMGASVADVSTRYGSEDFPLLLGGVAWKTGYNWELAQSKFIIQPSYLMSYSFVDAFDYTNAAGVKIKDSTLNAINIAPGLKFIGNLKNGWQPYFSIQMVWNIMDKTKFTAADIQLPYMSVKPFIQYGVGIQKHYGDRFTGYFQAVMRNGGRNGVALSLGFRWALGKHFLTSNTRKEIKSVKIKTEKTKPQKQEINKVSVDIKLKQPDAKLYKQ